MEPTEAARAVWAKSPDSDEGWLPLWQHMDDAADTANFLFDRWLPRSVVRLLGDDFGGDPDAARTAVTFLAGIHDLGKATPVFARKHTLLAQTMQERGLYIQPRLEDPQLAHHSVAGHHLLVQWLIGQGWERERARTWGVVLAGHHGVTPDSGGERDSRPLPSDDPDRRCSLYGSGTWEDVQRELLERVVARTGADAWLGQWREVKLSTQFQVLATALVIVSDWIASNSDLFPFHHGPLPEVVEGPQRMEQALHTLGLPRPWSPSDVPAGVTELFTSRFELPGDAEPRPIQEETCAVAWEMPEPGLLTLEAPMGEGKTEAALAAAEIVASRWGSGGLLVALPTQATSDAMFDRVVRWLDAMGAADQQVAGAITLSHGKARLNRTFQGLVRAGAMVDVDLDHVENTTRRRQRPSHAVLAHSWLSGRKKSQLANFAVGTIDQLLFAGLKSRHLMLRHLGLAGKVVVIDEVHAYDTYMSSYLLKVMSWLGAYRVPVIALSATLPADRRQALAEAYLRGRDGKNVDVAAAGGDIGYPALSWTADNAVRTRIAAESGRATTVSLGHVADDPDELVALLSDTLSDGGVALVVHNTVRRVLETAQRLHREFPGEVTVAHSRFIAADRLRKDTELLDSFGPPGRATQRPRRHIVVASQVVEQSLDVDFDVLVTDLAPVDLVLQRMGRLHRHQRGVRQNERPTKVRQAHTYITGVDFSGEWPELDAGARTVYGTYPLLRAAAVLWPRISGVVELPGDIAPLVQQAYGSETVGPATWQEAITAAYEDWAAREATRTGKAGGFQINEPARRGKPIVGWLHAGIGETEDDSQGQGQVRDGAPSLEALLVVCEPSGRWRTPSWLEDGMRNITIPRDDVPPEAVANTMASCSIRLPLTFSNGDAEEDLWNKTPVDWERSPMIYRLPALVVDENGWGTIAQQQVNYTPDTGLTLVDGADG